MRIYGEEFEHRRIEDCLRERGKRMKITFCVFCSDAGKRMILPNSSFRDTFAFCYLCANSTVPFPATQSILSIDDREFETCADERNFGNRNKKKSSWKRFMEKHSIGERAFELEMKEKEFDNVTVSERKTEKYFFAIKYWRRDRERLRF